MIAAEFPGLFSFAELAAMDYRDLMFWATEAMRKMIGRRLERYNAALMPHQKPDVIKSEMGGLALRMSEIDMDSEIERTERENAELIKAARSDAGRHIHRRKRKKAGKPAFLHVKTAMPRPARQRKVV